MLRTVVRRFHQLSESERFLGRCNIVKPGKVTKKQKLVPDHIRKPDYYDRMNKPGNTLGDVEIKNNEQIHRMRTSCKLAAQILASCGEMTKPGVTTEEIDAFVHERVIAAKAYPSPLRYAGFPKSVCTSVNNVACHGIPDDRPLMDGDIINVDVTVFLNGYHGDCSKTFLVGNVDDRGCYLVKSTEECLEKCIEICGPNVPFKAIGSFITKFCMEKSLGLIPAFVGHGIGSYFHGPPEIAHYENNLPGEMKAGMTFTIEPILTLGSSEIEILDDGWTAVTTDDARSAQFEHTILITGKGAEILTKPT